MRGAFDAFSLKIQKKTKDSCITFTVQQGFEEFVQLKH